MVAVTGAARGIGHALAVRLAESPMIGRVVAIDDHRGDAAGVTWRVADVRDPTRAAARLSEVDVVVHADMDTSAAVDGRQRRAFNVRGAQTVLTAAAAERVGRVVLVTSAMVYGARPDNPVPLPEDAPLLADADGSVAGDLLEIEELARRSRRVNPGTAVTVVRPAAMVGDAVDTLLTRHFEAPRLLIVRGCAPRWQFCHIDDLVTALELAAAGVLGGDFAVGCDGWLEQAQVEELSGIKSFELPARLTFGTAQRLHRLGVTPAPAADLRYMVYPWVVDCAALRGAGWRPARTNDEALSLLLAARSGHRAVAGRRIARKEAAITAAAGTAAVIGTAAIVRAARRRNRTLSIPNGPGFLPDLRRCATAGGRGAAVPCARRRGGAPGPARYRWTCEPNQADRDPRHRTVRRRSAGGGGGPGGRRHRAVRRRGPRQRREP